MDALLKALEARGYAVNVDTYTPTRTYVTVMDEKLAIGIRENQMQVPHLLTREERRKPYYGLIPKYDYSGTGEISLLIVDLEDYSGIRVRRRWADAKKQRVEDCLGRFIEGLVVAAKAIKASREELERKMRRHAVEQRRREQERRLRGEERRQHEQEEQRVQQLLKDAQAWAQSETLRAHLRAAADQKQRVDGEIAPGSDFAAWLEWGYGAADRLDPLGGEK